MRIRQRTGRSSAAARRTSCVRAMRFEEQDRGYVVGDITIDGRSIQFAGQLALRVRVRIEALQAHRPSAAIAPTLYWVIYVAAVV